MVVIAPLVAAAGIQTLGGLAGGLLGQGSKNKQIEGDWALQNYVAQQNAANNIMGLNASLGQGMSNNRWSNVLGPDLDQARQFTAAKQKFDFLAPKENALNRENARWSIGASLDPSSREAGFQALLNENRKVGFDKLVASDAMFGPTGFSNRFTRNA
jgi:hypothetical protein